MGEKSWEDGAHTLAVKVLNVGALDKTKIWWGLSDKLPNTYVLIEVKYPEGNKAGYKYEASTQIIQDNQNPTFDFQCVFPSQSVDEKGKGQAELTFTVFETKGGW